ncbi:hypothetical protein [uncultured Aquimarina sp.]|uniref:hypothetical protein n=1 Tax=uncultured Aquimarina sp. TaxID=575652 RepID=UPI002614F251|nr:hypothetical protein [uncultured Aquimarina sp.]
MKKILTTLFLFVLFTTSYAQENYHQKRNTYYVEAAAKEFDLDQKQQSELSKIRMEMVEKYRDSNKSFKAGEISEEEKKKINKEASTTFHNKLSKLTGKNYKEMEPWLKKMREKMKKM